MAVASLGADSVRANPSRRHILAALAAAPVAFPAAAACAVPALTSWDKKLAAYEAAKREHENWHERVYYPVMEKVERFAPRPDLWFEVTARSGQTARYDMWPTRMDEYDNHISHVFREKAAAVREAWETHVAGRERFGLSALNKESDRLVDYVYDLHNELIYMPAPHLRALAWKVDQLFGPGIAREADEDGPTWCADYINALVSDVRRLCH